MLYLAFTLNGQCSHRDTSGSSTSGCNGQSLGEAGSIKMFVQVCPWLAVETAFDPTWTVGAAAVHCDDSKYCVGLSMYWVLLESVAKPSKPSAVCFRSMLRSTR